MIRVLLVDDQHLVRVGLRRILEPDPDIEIVGECEDGDEVLDAVDRYQPDVVVMDVRMRRIGGPEAIRQLRARDSAPPPVLILTTFDDEETVAAAFAAGAAGFILKDAPGEDIVTATKTVAAGGSWLDAQILGLVLATFRRTVRQPDAAVGRVKSLTQRELDVLREVGIGATNAEVAEALFISEATVKTHLANVLAKLELRDRSALIVFAQSNSLLGDSR